MVLRRSGLAAAVLLVALLGSIASATAAPGWRGPVEVTESDSTATGFPRVTARPGSCTTVAFKKGDFVWASTRPPGGPFGPSQPLGGTAPAVPAWADVGGGVSAVVWEDPGGDVTVATAEGCDPLAAPVDVPGTYMSPTDAAVEVDSNGTVLAAFSAGGSGSRRVHVSERPVGGSPTSPTPIAPPAGTEAFRPRPATNGVGGAAVVFDVVSTTNDVYASRRTGPGSWSTPVQLNEEEKPAIAGKTRAAMGPDGSVHAVWIEDGSEKVIFGSLDPAGSVDEPELMIESPSLTFDEPAIAAGPEGRLTVAWVQVAGANRTIKAKPREPGQTEFSGQENVSATTSMARGNVQVAIDSHGRTVVAWSAVASTLGAISKVMVSTLPAGSPSFTGELRISDEDEYTSPSSISADADGNTLVALYRTDDPREAKVAAFDAAGPLLQGLAIPAGGFAGIPTSFSVSPVDAWSATEPASWLFGDGGSAEGDSTTHTYDAVGTYPVEVSVADELGNVSQAAGSTAIGPPPPIPAGTGSGAGKGKGKGRGADSGPAPRLSRLALSRTRFRAAPRRPARSATASRRLRVGTRVGYRLSEAATVRFVVHRRLPGLRARIRGRVRCVKPTRALRRRGAKRCVRLRRRGAFRRAGARGLNRFFFSGWIGRKKLGPGRYRLRAIAIDGDGKRSAPRSAGFVIRRR